LIRAEISTAPAAPVPVPVPAVEAAVEALQPAPPGLAAAPVAAEARAGNAVRDRMGLEQDARQQQPQQQHEQSQSEQQPLQRFHLLRRRHSPSETTHDSGDLPKLFVILTDGGLSIYKDPSYRSAVIRSIRKVGHFALALNLMQCSAVIRVIRW
jgi:hypothetical protein